MLTIFVWCLTLTTFLSHINLNPIEIFSFKKNYHFTQWTNNKKKFYWIRINAHLCVRSYTKDLLIELKEKKHYSIEFIRRFVSMNHYSIYKQTNISISGVYCIPHSFYCYQKKYLKKTEFVCECKSIRRLLAFTQRTLIITSIVTITKPRAVEMGRLKSNSIEIIPLHKIFYSISLDGIRDHDMFVSYRKEYCLLLVGLPTHHVLKHEPMQRLFFHFVYAIAFCNSVSFFSLLLDSFIFYQASVFFFFFSG